MDYNCLYKQRILELLKLCTDVETENEMLLKQIEEQSVKIKEMENMIHILKNQYIIPIETPMWDHSWDIHRYPMLEYTDGTKFHFVPYIS